MTDNTMNNNIDHNIDYDITYIGSDNEKVTEDICAELYEEFANTSDDEDADNYEAIYNNNEDKLIALIISYNSNYKMSELIRIAEYYNISLNSEIEAKKKKKKEELVNNIVDFEEDGFNEDIVNRRKLLWFYIDEIKMDEYLKKHVVINI